ncbi:hypothetical protein [Halopiger aswanensis]|uniref:Uncharacterized protein n=1 Tax=Halopiger aswanensis TaxID=148449 RepID=A0A419WRW5_9EURY|nr:hypothetical protein [Halopiger aswanensis]RKD98233.1 hypothetical protein ATJ93_1238 [Halopiger aswanensis]
MPEFTDDDRGKPVENANGDRVGTIETVEDDIAYVRPNADAVDSIKSSIGWESRADEPLPLDHEAVAEVTDDAIRLEGSLLEHAPDDGGEESTADASTDRTEPAGSMSGMDETDVSEPMEDDESEPDEATDRGLSADPSELTDDASGFEVNPDDMDDEFQRSDATVDPEEDAQRSDAAVNPDDADDGSDADADTDEDGT